MKLNNTDLLSNKIPCAVDLVLVCHAINNIYTAVKIALPVSMVLVSTTKESLFYNCLSTFPEIGVPR